MKITETKEKIKSVLSEIQVLQDGKELMAKMYNENIAFKKIQLDLLAIELAEKYISDFRILKLCRTGK